jgi:hypothetical protein
MGIAMSYGYEYLRKPEHPSASLIERILSVMAVLGLACLFIGSILFVSGNGFSNCYQDSRTRLARATSIAYNQPGAFVGDNPWEQIDIVSVIHPSAN